MKLVFMGTPAFALPTLKALHEGGHEIVAVYTQQPRPAHRGQKDTPSPVSQYAQQHKLPVHIPVSLKSLEIQKAFAAHKAEAAIVAAYGLLLPKPILEAYPRGCINVHPSLLPRWRGAAPIQRTIMAGDKTTGITIMQMNEGLDTGDMLLVEKYDIPEGMNAGELHDLLAEKAGPMLLKVLSGSATPQKQPEVGVTYAHKITKEECRIDWTKPAEFICHQIRGLAPSPGAHFSYKEERIKILEADFYPSQTSIGIYKPGTVIDEHGRMVICGEGILAPKQVQRPGKKAMSMYDMTHGFEINQYDILS